jgi:hypothetical protein
MKASTAFDRAPAQAPPLAADLHRQIGRHLAVQAQLLLPAPSSA